MKRCSKCGAEKELENFARLRRAKDGHRAQCKLCDKHYREENVERERQRHKDRREAGASTGRTAARREYDKNRYKAKTQEIAEQQRKYRARSSDKRAAWEAKRRARKLNAPQGDPIETTAYEQILREGICEICGSDGPIEIDHIEPLSKGGAHDWTNMAGLCKSCNSSKGDKSLLHFLLGRLP